MDKFSDIKSSGNYIKKNIFAPFDSVMVRRQHSNVAFLKNPH